ncbi:MAG TPA: hypothetical protein VEL12_04140 [Candidatus Nitrosopolaris sp.]|nr:hypothetical protein [Candidatus Nitrosopolaris sp.]
MEWEASPFPKGLTDRRVCLAYLADREGVAIDSDSRRAQQFDRPFEAEQAHKVRHLSQTHGFDDVGVAENQAMNESCGVEVDLDVRPVEIRSNRAWGDDAVTEIGHVAL